LREFGIPPDKLGWALGFFNVGVEVGQLGIVGAAFALLLAADASMRSIAGQRDGSRSRSLVWGISAAILLLGLFWAWERAGPVSA
jgi:hypothetical protein